MTQQRVAMREGLFWGTTAALFAAIMGGAIAYVVAAFSGAGWLAGGALGVLIFVAAGWILGANAGSSNLPAPNTLRAPVAPPGGAHQAPPGGAFRMPGGPTPADRSTPAYDPAPAPSFADMTHSAGEAVGKAAYSASAAVTSAAQAARAAISDVLDSSTSSAPTSDTAAMPAETASASPAPPAPRRPEMLAAPREGGPDDLKRIKGIGPKLEDMLHAFGYYHFDQIAAWGEPELAWVDANLEGFYGRASRDDWIGQAKTLAAGGETEHSRRVDQGEV